jgi:hypothetical protein
VELQLHHTCHHALHRNFTLFSHIYTVDLETFTDVLAAFLAVWKLKYRDLLVTRFSYPVSQNMAAVAGQGQTHEA